MCSGRGRGTKFLIDVVSERITDPSIYNIRHWIEVIRNSISTFDCLFACNKSACKEKNNNIALNNFVHIFLPGKVFALLMSAETGVSVVSSPMYSQVYNATIKSFPATIFFLSIGIECIVFILIL